MWQYGMIRLWMKSHLKIGIYQMEVEKSQRLIDGNESTVCYNLDIRY